MSNQTEIWKGFYKLQEECGELQQVLGKLGPFPDGNHPDGKGDLIGRLQEEMADTIAALKYFEETNGLNTAFISARATEKLEKFRKWGLTGIKL